ncbi:hypothetical protein AB8A21_40575 [Streptomyces sp. BF23-18]|uniref:hypothetical protein n=1 Tax=Streptomyces sp. BF23-18 TaxID=3240282 RepID=UPI0034E55319
MSHHLLTLLNSPFATALLATRAFPITWLALTAAYARTHSRRQAALRALAVLLGRSSGPRT